MNKIDVLRSAMDKALYASSLRRFKNPGEIIKSLSQEDRAELSKLKSDDIAFDKVRLDMLYDTQEVYERKCFKNILMKFDKEFFKI